MHRNIVKLSNTSKKSGRKKERGREEERGKKEKSSNEISLLVTVYTAGSLIHLGQNP